MATADNAHNASDLRVTRWEYDAATGGYWLSFTCADAERFQALVSAIRLLPAQQRRWMLDTKAWWIGIGAVPYLRAASPVLARAMDTYASRAGDRGSYYHHQQHQQQRTAGASMPTDTERAFATLYLRQDAPPQVVRAAYRALAPLLHPDHQGGDEAAMKRLNVAHEHAMLWAEQHSAVPMPTH